MKKARLTEDQIIGIPQKHQAGGVAYPWLRGRLPPALSVVDDLKRE